jgi:glutamate/tyrosine decarboxylase-like PLP-dependent enzyme
MAADGADELRRRLRDLEQVARQLDPDRSARDAMLEAVRDCAEDFLERLPSIRAFTADQGSDAFASPLFGEEPAPVDELTAFFDREITSTGANTAGPGYLAYVPGGGVYPAALGDYLADVTNRYASVAFAGPGAARLEQALVRWMCDLVGYPHSAAGDLTSGGSIATLSALVTARDAHGITPDRVALACAYMTAQAHHCIRKALHVAGLGRIKIRVIPMGQRFRMDPAALREQVAADRQDGLQPWLVVASAGTTDTGAIDPIPEVASIAAREKLWLHVDAAYGGFFLLCEEGRRALPDISRADSVVLDPHKGLSLPFGSGAVLVRKGARLTDSFSYFANYLQDTREGGVAGHQGFSPADHSPELSRPFRGPRMWFPLKLFGLRPFRAALQEKIWLARYFHREIAALDGFVAGPPPDLTIVTFRYLPRNGDANAFNRRLIEAVLADGRVFISSTLIDDVFTLRLAVLNFRTHLDTVDTLLGLLREKAAELER